MKLRLSDVLDNLLYGEFAQTGWAQDGEFSIANVNKIIVLLNSALADISSRFWIKRKEVFLQTCKGKTLYVIDNSVASQQMKLQGGNGGLKTSTGEVWEDDLQSIYEIYDCNGNELHIAHDVGSPHDSAGRTCKCGNKLTPDELDDMCFPCRQKRFKQTIDKPATITTRYHPYGMPNIRPGDSESVQLAAYNTIRIPDDMPAQKLRVVYRAAAKPVKKIVDKNLYDPTRIFIDVPYEYLQAILNFIASRKFNSNKSGVQGGMHEGNNYYQKYIAACTLLQDQGSGVEPVDNNGSKFEDSGFV